MFENELINGIHISRYVSSWLNSGGYMYKSYVFRDWLESLIINGRHLTEEEVNTICDFGTCGKLELEMNARSYLSKKLQKRMEYALDKFNKRA